jgi:hypothetical protein
MIPANLRISMQPAARQAGAFLAAAAAAAVALAVAAPAFAAGESLPMEAAWAPALTEPTVDGLAVVVNEAAANPLASEDQAAPTPAAPQAPENDSVAGPEATPSTPSESGPVSGQSGEGDESTPSAVSPNEAPSGGANGSAGSPAANQPSSVSQSAGSTATTVQIAPINIAIPILINSTAIIKQTNSAAASSTATNWSNIVQVLTGQFQGGAAGGLSGSGGSGAAGNGTALSDALSQALGSIAGGAAAATEVNFNWTWTWNWNWNWNWNWDTGWNPGDVGFPGFPTTPSQVTTAPAPHSHVGPLHRVMSGPAVPEQLLGPGARADSKRGPSSSIVQIPAPPPFLSPGNQTGPGAPGGGGVSPLTLLIGALVALLLQLSSAAGLLGRRLRLGGAGWRRQAYLAPLQRPG